MSTEHPYREFKRLEHRIPLVDLRRVERYGPCRGPFGRPCSKRAMRDDVHFPSCPQAEHSDSMICLEWR